MREEGRQGVFRCIRGSLVRAAVLLACDAVIGGGVFMMSMLVCPVWILISLLQSAIHPPGFRLALFRLGVPALILGFVLANNGAQVRVAEARSRRVVAACEAYHTANGKFPEKLDDLVPQYMPYVPSARYCPGPWSQFHYFNRENPSLFWYIFPPYDRKIYDFETRRWHYMS
jgi:hypothetical protein